MATNLDYVLKEQEEPRTDLNSPLWLLGRGERGEAGSPGRAWGHPEEGRGGEGRQADHRATVGYIEASGSLPWSEDERQ